MRNALYAARRRELPDFISAVTASTLNSLLQASFRSKWDKSKLTICPAPASAKKIQVQ